MKYIFYYMYYKLYQWSEKRDRNIPIFVTVVWITVTMFFNVNTVLSLITICTGIDADHLFRIHVSNSTALARMSIWGLLVWLGLRIFHVHERAFSTEAVKTYKELGCEPWWVIAYFMASYVAMALSAWFAGKRLGLHS
jgi:CDP-diglyceride synthetase